MSEVVIQDIGFVGGAFFKASYQIKSNKALSLFACQLAGCMIFCIRFFWVYTGALSLIINTIRNVLLLKVNNSI